MNSMVLILRFCLFFFFAINTVRNQINLRKKKKGELRSHLFQEVLGSKVPVPEKCCISHSLILVQLRLTWLFFILCVVNFYWSMSHEPVCPYRTGCVNSPPPPGNQDRVAQTRSAFPISPLQSDCPLRRDIVSQHGDPSFLTTPAFPLVVVAVRMATGEAPRPYFS